MALAVAFALSPAADADEGWHVDQAFGDHGRIWLAPQRSGSPGQVAAAARPDGSLVVLVRESQQATRVLRYTAAGQLDTGFATGGELVLPGIHSPVAWDLGSADTLTLLLPTGTEGAYTLLRYTSGGQPDSAFDGDGALSIVLTGGFSWGGIGLVVDDTGAPTLIASGLSINGVSSSAFTTIVRRTADGSADEAFGTDGVATFTAFSGYLIGATETGIYLMNSHPLGQPDRISRITSTGELDLLYGSNGFADLLGPGAVGAMLVEPDGSVLTAAEDWPRGSEAITVQRLTPLGQPDPTFAGGGRVAVGFAGMHPHVTNGGDVPRPVDIARLDATHFVVFCDTVAGAAVAAITTSGVVDTEFGNLGRAYIPSGSASAHTISMIQGFVAADGALLVLGQDWVDMFLQRSVDSDTWVGQPAAPTNLVASAVVENGTVGVSASWTPATSTPLATITAQHYRLRRNADGAYIVDGNVQGTSWTTLGLRPGSYTVSVWAETAYGEGAVASALIDVPAMGPTILIGATANRPAERFGVRAASSN